MSWRYLSGNNSQYLEREWNTDMRTLQVFGLIVGVIIGLYGVWKYKRGAFSRGNFLITMGLAFALLVISLFPSAGDVIATPLRMERWNGVLFAAVLVLVGLFFYVLNQVNASNRTINRLVQSLAQIRFREEHPDLPSAEIMVIIPAYNEAENIGEVLTQIPPVVSGLKTQTIVVVDGASDATETVVRNLGVPVIVNPINRGGGAALRAGYQAAIERRARIVVTLDADGQHLPEEMPLLVEPIVKGEADFVNGSRVLGSFEQESAIRSFGVVVFNWLITVLMAKNITDSSNAYRAIHTDVLKKIDLQQDQFHTSEMLINALKKGARVKEVGITIRRRQQGVTKKPRSLKYGWGFLKAILDAWWR